MLLLLSIWKLLQESNQMVGTRIIINSFDFVELKLIFGRNFLLSPLGWIAIPVRYSELAWAPNNKTHWQNLLVEAILYNFEDRHRVPCLLVFYSVCFYVTNSTHCFCDTGQPEAMTNLLLCYRCSNKSPKVRSGILPASRALCPKDRPYDEIFHC